MNKELKPIRNDAEYELALKEASICFDQVPELGTAAADRFEALLILIEKYEAQHHIISASNSV
jgi:HTH-type transcriptional regulator/antitoxin HigA